MSTLNTQQEGAFLAQILHDQSVEKVLAAKITPEFLGDMSCRFTLQKILSYANENGGDIPGATWLAQNGIPKMPVYQPAAGSIESQIEAVRLGYLSRQLGQAGHKLLQQINNDPVAALTEVRKVLASDSIASLTAKSEEGSFATGFAEILQIYKDTVELDGVVGLPTPFETMTKKLGGWQKGSLYTLFAPAKNYKSWIILLTCALLYKAGIRTLIVSSEMPIIEMNERLVCLVEGISYTQWQDRKLSPAVMEQLEAQISYHAERLGNTINHYQPKGRGLAVVGEVQAYVNKMNIDNALGLVVWDSAYRSARSEQWEDIYAFIRSVRAATLETDLPWIVTAQEGSSGGQATHKVYRQESSALVLLEKVGANTVVLASKALRMTTGFRILVNIDLEHGTFTEAQQLSLDDEAPPAPVIEAGFGG